MSTSANLPELFSGRTVIVRLLEPGVLELCLDRKGESVNKFDDLTVGELREAVRCIAATTDLRGVLVTSAKLVFAVGADIGGLAVQLQLSEEEIAQRVQIIDAALDALEDLDVPTVAEINGYAVGGGMELALACSARVMSTQAQVGLPEVKLGLIPGAGGNVRLPRVAGARPAVQWITTGELHGAEAAPGAGVVDRTCDPEQLRAASLEMLRQGQDGKLASPCNPPGLSLSMRMSWQLRPPLRLRSASWSAVPGSKGARRCARSGVNSRES